jgi:hypothetical protein
MVKNNKQLKGQIRRNALKMYDSPQLCPALKVRPTFRNSIVVLRFAEIGLDWVRSVRRSLFGLLYQPRMIDNVFGAVGEMRIGRGKGKVFWENLPQCQAVHRKSLMTSPGLESRPARWEFGDTPLELWHCHLQSSPMENTSHCICRTHQAACLEQATALMVTSSHENTRSCDRYETYRGHPSRKKWQFCSPSAKPGTRTELAILHHSPK